MTSPLQARIDKKGPIETIGVIGMGYVGIPAAVLFADVPHFAKVYGFQRNSPSSGYKIDMLNRGELPLKGEELGFENQRFVNFSFQNLLRQCSILLYLNRVAYHGYSQ